MTVPGVSAGARGARLQPLLDERPDVGEPAVLADGGRARAAHLDAVVLGGVVRRREHRARQAEVPRGEVELVGGAQSDDGDVRALGGGAAGESGGQAGRGRAHVVADDDRVGSGDLGEGGAEQLGERLVPLIRHDSAHVVRLDDLRQISSH